MLTRISVVSKIRVVNNYDVPKLQLALRRKFWTKAQLAKKAGVSVSTVQRTFETGSAHPRTIEKLAKALEVDPESLVVDPSPKRKTGTRG